MGIALLLIVGIGLLFYSVRHTIRAVREVLNKNKSTASPWKRSLNWPVGMIWSACLLTFSLGLLINNLLIG